MRFYRYPKWLRTLYPGAIWDFFSHKNKSIYLTFDDGPTEHITPAVLEILDQFNAKATFFCLGKNVDNHAGILAQIKAKGHRIGNHGMNHLNGYVNNDEVYLNDAKQGFELTQSKLFRPAYGRLKRSQFRLLKKEGYQIILWSVLSYDFDKTIKPEKIIQVLENKVKPGSIIVFHDSEKAWPNLKVVLPTIMERWKQKGFVFESISV